MSKYNPLSERLSGHADDEWRASFAELEEVLGFPLPKGARGGTSWWANDPEKSHSRAWTGAGWEIAEVDRLGEAVTFRRNAASAEIEAAGAVEATHAQPSVDEPAAPRPRASAGGGPSWAAGSDAVQPAAMRRAAEGASRNSKLRKAMPMVAAGAAVLAGVATFAARVLIRRQGMRS